LKNLKLMKSQDIFIAQPETAKQVNALKAFMEALKIKFEISNIEQYAPEFVEKILESRREAKNGMVTRIEKANLKTFLGL